MVDKFFKLGLGIFIWLVNILIVLGLLFGLISIFS